MKFRSFLMVVGLTLIAGLAQAAPAGKVILFLQQDMRSSVDNNDFERAMDKLGGYLGGADLEIVSYARNDFKSIYSGPADKLKWPPEKHSFIVVNSATTPYKNLLKYLKENKIAEQAVYVIGTGTSQDMFSLMDTDQGLPGGISFVPNRYPVLDELIKYGKENKVKLSGIYVKDRSVRSKYFHDMTFNAFCYVMESSGGKAYFNYNTFEGIFKAIFQEGK